MSDAASALLAHIKQHGQIESSRIDDFYKTFPQHKATLQSALYGTLKGPRAFVASNAERGIACRRVGDKWLIFAIDEVDDLTAMLAGASLAHAVSGEDALPAVETFLSSLKSEMSMNKLKNEIARRGICLRDGTEKGDDIRKYIRQKEKRVSTKRAKEFPLARKCLVPLG